MAMHHTRAFSYHSLDDDRENTEMWRDLVLGAGVVILTIFCPPAGLTAGVVLASADMYSAATGKDWGTGRELDTTERGLRAGFALFDLIPGVGYMNDVAKSGSKLAAKEFLQTGLKEGLEQGVKNLDSFKGLVKHVGQFGDNVLKNIDHYAKQVGNLTKGKVASAADNLASQLRHADDTLSKAAQNFSLNNIGFEPQLVSGAIPTPPPGRLSGVADNLQAFAKSLSGSVDEVVEAGAKSGDDVPRLKEIEVKFKQSQKHDEIEFTRQLTDQEAGMNQLTVQEYLDNRERYIAEGRAIEGNAAQQAARKKALADKVIEFREMGLSRSEAKIRAQEWLDTQAALHNPDQIAGGFADRIGGMGDTRINSSIGSQWRYRIDIVDDQIKRMASEMTPDQLRSTYLNVKLTY